MSLHYENSKFMIECSSGFPGNYSAQARKDFFSYHASSDSKNVLYTKSKNKIKHHPASISIPRKNSHGIEKCSAQEYEIMKVCHRVHPIIFDIKREKNI